MSRQLLCFSCRSSRLPARITTLLALLFGLSAMAADEGTIWVVARQDAPIASLTLDEIADLFLGRRHSTLHLTPVDRSDDALRERFYRAVSGMSLMSVRAYWAKQVFTGRGRPAFLATEEDAARLVTDHPDVVTFIVGGRLPPGSKVLLVIEPGGNP